MLNVGVIGLGVMGSCHLDVYDGHGDGRIVALSDKDPIRLPGRVMLDEIKELVRLLVGQDKEEWGFFGGFHFAG